MKLTTEQMEAAVELLDRRLRERGGPVGDRARELCEGELRGVLTAEELAGSWRPETVTARWRGRERDRPPRRIDYYDPAELRDYDPRDHFGEATTMVPDHFPEAGEMATESDGAEIVRLVLLLLEPGGGLLRREVRWHGVRYVLRPGETWRVVRGPGGARLGDPSGLGKVVEWTRGAVIIEREGAVTRIFPEHRKKALERGRNRLVMERPEIEASALELRRLAMSAAVLLLLLRRPAQWLGNGAAIARAAGVTRAAVSARKVRMEEVMGELAAAEGQDRGQDRKMGDKKISKQSNHKRKDTIS